MTARNGIAGQYSPPRGRPVTGNPRELASLVPHIFGVPHGGACNETGNNGSLSPNLEGWWLVRRLDDVTVWLFTSAGNRQVYGLVSRDCITIRYKIEGDHRRNSCSIPLYSNFQGQDEHHTDQPVWRNWEVRYTWYAKGIRKPKSDVSVYWI